MKTYLKALTISLGILALSTIHGFAASWSASSNKGMAIYEIGKASTAELKLFCDPDNLWADDNTPHSQRFYLMASLNNHTTIYKTISLMTDRGFSGSFDFSDGTAWAYRNKPEWNKMIKALSGPRHVTVQAGKEQFTLDITEKTALRCAIHR